MMQFKKVSDKTYFKSSEQKSNLEIAMNELNEISNVLSRKMKSFKAFVWALHIFKSRQI